MRLGSISLRSERRWWWLFGLLIAAPALVLALSGLRVAQLERMERLQQIREQQAQLARLADTTLSSILVKLQNELTSAEASPSALHDYTVFVVDTEGRLLFPRDKTYPSDPGKPDPRPEPAWTPETGELIERAQAAETQRRTGEAAALYGRAGTNEPRLRAWSQLALARLRLEQDGAGALTTLANPLWVRSDGVTPNGLPVAFLAAAAVEDTQPAQRARFAPLLQATIDGLRAGRWWLSFEERRFYDQELRRLLELAGKPPAPEDPRPAEWAAIERMVRRARPSEEAGHPSDPDVDTPFLTLWSGRSGGGWLGAAIPRDQLAASTGAALSPLFSAQPFRATIRHAKGLVLWSQSPAGAPMGPTTPLRAVTGWELAFSAPDTDRRDPRRLLWYGFTLLVVTTLSIGVAVTVHVVRREAELSRLQSEFVATVTHEFKSPITSIRLLMERLAGGRVRTSAAAGEYHDAINRETDRLERLVNRVLESQKIQAGEKRYSFVMCSLADLAQSAIWRLRPQAEAKNIAVDFELAGEIPQIRMDKTAVADALDNLVDNAIRYSPVGARVIVRVEQRDQYLCTEVQDQGIGIDEEDLPRIFDRFYRGRRGDQHNVHGTGLGLALVKAAAEGHGGRVEVSSTPGQGSRFCLRLPLER